MSFVYLSGKWLKKYTIHLLNLGGENEIYYIIPQSQGKKKRNLQGIMLRGISQMKKDKHCMASFMCGIKKQTKVKLTEIK